MNMIFIHKKTGELIECSTRKAEVIDFHAVVEYNKKMYHRGYVDPSIFDYNVMVDDYLANRKYVYIIENNISNIVATMSLARNAFSQGVLEFLTHSVLSEYRGYGLSDHIVQYIINETMEECTSFHCHAAMYTNAIQFAFENNGFKIVGILPCIIYSKYVPTDDAFDYPKISLAYYAKKTILLDVGTIYLPNKLKNKAEKVYKNLSVSLDICSDSALLIGESKISNNGGLDVSDTLWLTIDYAGSDLLTQIDSLEKQHKTELITTIVFMNITSDSATAGICLLEKKGYKFWGFNPLTQKGEYLIIAKLENLKVDFTKMKFTKETQAFIEEVLDFEK